MNGIGVSLHGLSEKPIRVCIIEDHAVVRTGLRMLIETRDGRAQYFMYSGSFKRTMLSFYQSLLC